MSVIRLNAFGGEVPKMSNRLLPDNSAQIARNVDLQSGSIKTINDSITVETPTKVGTKKTIYRWNGGVANIGSIQSINVASGNLITPPSFQSSLSPEHGTTTASDRNRYVSLSDDGSIMAIGSTGQGFNENTSGVVWAYDVVGGVPTNQQQLSTSKSSINQFVGGCVCVSGDGSTIAAGAKGDLGSTNTLANAGAVFVWTRVGGVWTEQAYIVPDVESSQGEFGWAVSLSTDGNTLVVSAPLEDYSGYSNLGALYIFRRSGSTWTQQTRIPVSSLIYTTQKLGMSLVLSKDGTKLFAAQQQYNNGPQIINFYVSSGGVFPTTPTQQIYNYTSGWLLGIYQVNQYDGSYSPSRNMSCSADGSLLVVGAPSYEVVGTDRGAVFVYTESGGTYSLTQTLTPTTDDFNYSYFGASVGVNDAGTILAVGASLHDDPTSDEGAVYTFTRTTGDFSEDTMFQAPNVVVNTKFGGDVWVSGDGSKLGVCDAEQQYVANEARYHTYTYLYLLSELTVTAVTSQEHVLSTNDVVTINDVLGSVELNGNSYPVTVISPTSFSFVSQTTVSEYLSGGQFVNESGVWFHWITDVDVMQGPIADDTIGRTYYTGDGVPKVTYAPVATSGGGTNYPNNSYDLGIPAPTSQPTMTIGQNTGTITDITNANPPVVTSVAHGKRNGDTMTIAGVVGLEKLITPQTISGAISGATQANPVVITASAHGRTTGDRLQIAGIVGMTELNDNEYTITVIDANSYSLDGIDGSGYNAYTSGGTWTLNEYESLVNGNEFTIDLIDDDTFSLRDIDGSAHSAYVSGGTWTQTWEQSLLESRAYVYTLVSAIGEEGPPSPPSLIVDLGTDQSVTVSGLAAPPAGNYNWGTGALKRLYRSFNGEYRFVAEFDIAQTSYVDGQYGDDLGEVIPSTDWDPPPADLQGLVMMANGIAVGFTGKELCFSEPYIPHAWPVGYRITLEYDIVAVKPTGTSIVVGTVGKPYLITGIDPSALSSDQVELQQPCVSKRSMVDMGEYVVYASPDGLVAVGPGIAKLLSREEIGEKFWKSLDPKTIEGYYYEQGYVGFYDNGTEQAGFMYKYNDKYSRFTRITVFATAGHNVPQEDNLYLQVGANIELFQGSQYPLQYTWLSKVFENTLRANYSCAIVYAESYPVTMTLYGDGNKIFTKRVTNDDVFRLPATTVSRNHEIEIVGTKTVYMVMLAESPDELQDALGS